MMRPFWRLEKFAVSRLMPSGGLVLLRPGSLTAFVGAGDTFERGGGSDSYHFFNIKGALRTHEVGVDASTGKISGNAVTRARLMYINSQSVITD
jgi:hypothetical protein